MNCLHCQNAMNPQERFCSKCGYDSLANPNRPSYSPGIHNWDTHVQVLGWIFIVSAFLIAIGAMFLLLVPGLMMSGAANRPFPAILAIFALPLISISAGCIVAGIGLLNHRDWARVLALILAAFMLAGFPFGTAVGIYAFWVLLSSEGSRSYRRDLSAERKSLA